MAVMRVHGIGGRAINEAGDDLRGGDDGQQQSERGEYAEEHGELPPQLLDAQGDALGLGHAVCSRVDRGRQASGRGHRTDHGRGDRSGSRARTAVVAPSSARIRTHRPGIKASLARD